MNALQAGVMNVPFAPVRGLLGTDYMKIRPDFLRMANPYDPEEEIALVPALTPDVAVFHGFRADLERFILGTRDHGEYLERAERARSECRGTRSPSGARPRAM